MQFQPARDRKGIYRRYDHIVITETDADRRLPNEKRYHPDYYHTGQIVICEVGLDGEDRPVEVGTWGKPTKVGCTCERFEILNDAINFAYSVVGVESNAALCRYAYVVLTETDEDRRPPTDKREYHDYYTTAQIVVCEVDKDGGGIPVEVATWQKPGKHNCLYEKFDLLYRAIDFSYSVADGLVNPRKKGGYRRKSVPGVRKGKKRRKQRHKA